MKSFEYIDEDKIVFEELIKEFQVTNLDSFSTYLAEVWRDLALRSDTKIKGINKITFGQYYDLPGIISDRLFAVFDKNKNDYIDPKEFIEGMATLFTQSFERLAKLIFEFYDFDKDGKITREDVRVVLSYVPLNTKNYSKKKLKFELEDFSDRVESQDELHRMLEKAFGKNEYLNQETFCKVVESVNSDIFLFILMFILEKKPFTKDTLKVFDAYSKSPKKEVSATPKIQSKSIISPTLKSKFKSPTLAKRNSVKKSNNSEKAAILGMYAGKPVNAVPLKVVTPIPIGDQLKKNPPAQESNDEDTVILKTPRRKVVQKLGMLEDKLPLGPIVNVDSQDEETGLSPVRETNYAGKNEGSIVNHEGYLYKITQSKKLKRLWFKLIGKDIYFFKTKNDSLHKGMHHLSGIFIKENSPLKFEDTILLNFSILYPKKVRHYYTDNEEEYTQWVTKLREAIEYCNLADQYDIKEKLGKGKFGLVKRGIHKESKREVAIKIMSKKEMTPQDLEMIKTEVDILKVAQHPYIIKLYDVFENAEYIYIIMEYCSGGDLFTYLENRNFRLSESKAAEIIHKLSTAVYYLHSYGIIHRDLKPENILMTDGTDSADIRLLDFGLSKILGPSETCSEPYGTLSYVAPEVLKNKPYNKSVDLWSLGVTTYLLLSGCLPFDDDHSEIEIARQTINDSVPFPSSIWKKLSSESKQFVTDLLQKDPSKRLSMRNILEHKWIQKFSIAAEKRKKCHDLDNDCQFKIYTTIVEEPQVTMSPKIRSKSPQIVRGK